ncbi:MAG: DNA cytosine methyltransferase, partial [Psychrobacillus psychrodurans]
LGFTQAGFRTIFANDIEPSCIETYRYNHPEVDPNRVILGDIQDFAKTVNDYTMSEHVDIVIGGPPCQGFSNANQQRVIDDPRNRLYKEFVNVVATVRPTFFVMENVIGMKDIADQILQDFENIGYKVNFEVLNAIDFGVPQSRKRIIFMGNKIGIDNKIIFNDIHKKNSTIIMETLETAIGDLPSLKALNIKNATNHESKDHGYFITSMYNYHSNTYLNRINHGQTPQFIYNHKARFNNDRDIEIFSRLHQGDKSDDPKIADIMPYTSRTEIFKDKYYKLIYNQPCKTITAHMKFDCNMYIHPIQARGLTPREAARVQSYPDNYYFKGPYTKTYMQIGNSVPPLMAKGIASEIIKYIQVVKEDEQLILPLSN